MSSITPLSSRAIDIQGTNQLKGDESEIHSLERMLTSPNLSMEELKKAQQIYAAVMKTHLGVSFHSYDKYGDLFAKITALMTEGEERFSPVFIDSRATTPSPSPAEPFLQSPTRLPKGWGLPVSPK